MERPFRAINIFCALNPRALPWAGMGAPLRGLKRHGTDYDYLLRQSLGHPLFVVIIIIVVIAKRHIVA